MTQLLTALLKQGALVVLLIVGLTALQAQSSVSKYELLNSAVSAKDFVRVSEISTEIAEEHYSAKKFTDAQKYADLAISYGKKTSIQKTLLLKPNLLLGRIYLAKQEYKKALEYFDKAHSLAATSGGPEIQLESMLLKSRCYAALKKFKKAAESGEEALSVALKLKSEASQLECYAVLEEYYLKAGNKVKSEEYKVTREALIQLQQREQQAKAKAAQLEMEYNREKENHEQMITEQKVVLAEQQEQIKVTQDELRVAEEENEKRQLEINLLSKDRELANLRIQEQESRIKNEALIRNSILVVLLLTAILVAVVIINYRKQTKAKHKIELQNKNIKSSINYAKRIQEAMLPKRELQQKYFPESFILFKPRDVVSGDFYWFSHLNVNETNAPDDVAIAAIDCTGHGVPGAFMSMIGINSLNAILSRGIVHADKILETLHKEIRSALKQDTTGNNDGMDASLCIYRRQSQTLEFAGAKNPLFYIQNKELIQIKGDIHSIGGSRSKHDLTYKKHEISIDKPTIVYLFSDGYRDQFGGPENQKFMGKRFSKLLLELHELPMDQQCQRLSDEFEKWKGTNEQTDDVLVIGLKLG